MKLSARSAALAFALAARLGAPAVEFDSWMARRDDMSDAERLRAVHASAMASIRAGGATAEGVEVHVEYWPDGNVKTLLLAGKAVMSQDRCMITAEGVEMRQFDSSGAVSASVSAGECTVDRKTRSAWVEGSAEFLWDGHTGRGSNIYFSFPDEFIKITMNSEFHAKTRSLDNLKMENLH